MPDIMNREKDLGALDDLGRLANITQEGRLSDHLRDFEAGLEAAELAKTQPNNEEKSTTEVITPDELVRALQRDMNMNKQDNER